MVDGSGDVVLVVRPFSTSRHFSFSHKSEQPQLISNPIVRVHESDASVILSYRDHAMMPVEEVFPHDLTQQDSLKIINKSREEMPVVLA